MNILTNIELNSIVLIVDKKQRWSFSWNDLWIWSICGIS